MFHRHYPCSKQTEESPTQAPETEQQERDDETLRRHGCSVDDQVAWIAGEEARQKGEQRIDGTCKSPCQEAEPTTDGYPPNDKTNTKAPKQDQRKSEQFQRCQSKSRLDSQPVHGNLLAGRVKRPCVDEDDQGCDQGAEYTSKDSRYQRREEAFPG